MLFIFWAQRCARDCKLSGCVITVQLPQSRFWPCVESQKHHTSFLPHSSMHSSSSLGLSMQTVTKCSSHDSSLHSSVDAGKLKLEPRLLRALRQHALPIQHNSRALPQQHLPPGQTCPQPPGRTHERGLEASRGRSSLMPYCNRAVARQCSDRSHKDRPCCTSFWMFRKPPGHNLYCSTPPACTSPPARPAAAGRRRWLIGRCWRARGQRARTGSGTLRLPCAWAARAGPLAPRSRPRPTASGANAGGLTNHDLK